RAFLEAPYRLDLTKAREFSEGDDEDDDDAPAKGAPGAGESGDPVLLAMLKDLRKDMSRKLGLQSWIIFNDNSLEDMAIFYPVSYDDLKKCQGVGEGKARKYGAEFIKLIAKYVEENDITRPDDFVMKSAVTKSAAKVAIIQSIDRKMDLEDIAAERGMEMEELISEMESIVYSGTRLNLNYIIDDMMDPENVEEVFDYFSEASSDTMSKAMEYFSGAYEENELRLLRLKFICDVAN
ncbi:MAG: HRDC domain-containing protein, partial [Bacteroidales bacterium]|nr:HRDC domain-containing protein [Bacteroidales bacterium]